MKAGTTYGRELSVPAARADQMVTFGARVRRDWTIFR